MPLLIFLFGLVVWFAFLLAEEQCLLYEKKTGIETTFSKIGGCYITKDGKTMPYSEFKARAMTNEIKR